MPPTASSAEITRRTRTGLAALFVLAATVAPGQAQDPPADTSAAEDSAVALPIFDLTTCEGLQAYRAAGARLSVAQAMDLTNCVANPSYQPSGTWQGFTASRPPGWSRGDPYGLSTFGDWSTIDRIDG